MGGGRPTVYRCEVAQQAFYEGRVDTAAQDHYDRSHWEQFRPGDPTVIALVDEVRRLRDRLEQAVLSDIEARNPGIDIERVAAERKARGEAWT